MTIMISNSKITTSEQLPDKVQTILQMIPQAGNWFTTMAADTQQTLQFTSIDVFVEQLIVGLHGVTLVYLNQLGLFIGGLKLLTLSDNDIRDLYYWNQNAALLLRVGANDSNNNPPKTTAQKRGRGSKSDTATGSAEPLVWPSALVALMDKYQLVSNADLHHLIDGFYQQNELGQNPLVWGATFAQQIICHETLTDCAQRYPDATGSIAPAIAWALDKAQSLSEFAHYYGIYLAWDNHSPADSNSSDLDSLLEPLATLVEKNLDCPVVTRQLDAPLLQQAMVQLGEQGKTLGFSGLSSGLLNIVLNIDLTDRATIAAQAADYIRQLQVQLETHLMSAEQVDQAGSIMQYYYALAGRLLVVYLDPQGCLSLYRDYPNLPGQQQSPASLTSTQREAA